MSIILPFARWSGFLDPVYNGDVKTTSPEFVRLGTIRKGMGPQEVFPASRAALFMDRTYSLRNRRRSRRVMKGTVVDLM